MTLPTAHEIEALHQKYAPTPDVREVVWTHCQIVRDIAAQLLARHNSGVDADLVTAGCLLHDIGVYPLFDEHGAERKDLQYITHGILGEAILQDEGYPATISHFASHHTGAGLTKLDITSQNLPLPVQNFEAETIEQAMVMYADKFHSKTDPPCFNTYGWFLEHATSFGPEKVSKFEDMARQFGRPDLTPLVEKYGHAVREK